MNVPIRKSSEFTGRHMLYVMLTFFGTVIAVNLTMATFARTSWTGLVVENTYVASQEFNRKAEEGREQAALGWTGTLTIAGGAVHYSLSDASGGLLALRSVTATFRHPAYEQEDRVISLARMADGTFGSKKTVVDGVWIVEIDADVGRQKPYRQVRRVVVADGAIR
ncbi:MULTISPECIES: FixH family protein [unclassified Mesorhizobium]|jgi:nitrogen fixation protein FixH|uniref:FixH family protein n=1 Tax=unclassified Mesorhizobium TaxID=325217 RepID=UPI0030149CBE